MNPCTWHKWDLVDSANRLAAGRGTVQRVPLQERDPGPNMDREFELITVPAGRLPHLKSGHDGMNDPIRASHPRNHIDSPGPAIPLTNALPFANPARAQPRYDIYREHELVHGAGPVLDMAWLSAHAQAAQLSG